MDIGTARQQCGLSEQAMADALQVDLATYRRIEAGDEKIGAVRCTSLAWAVVFAAARTNRVRDVPADVLEVLRAAADGRDICPGSR